MNILKELQYIDGNEYYILNTKKYRNSFLNKLEIERKYDNFKYSFNFDEKIVHVISPHLLIKNKSIILSDNINYNDSFIYNGILHNDFFKGLNIQQAIEHCFEFFSKDIQLLERFEFDSKKADDRLLKSLYRRQNNYYNNKLFIFLSEVSDKHQTLEACIQTICLYAYEIIEAYGFDTSDVYLFSTNKIIQNVSSSVLNLKIEEDFYDEDCFYFLDDNYNIIKEIKEEKQKKIIYASNKDDVLKINNECFSRFEEYEIIGYNNFVNEIIYNTIKEKNKDAVIIMDEEENVSSNDTLKDYNLFFKEYDEQDVKKFNSIFDTNLIYIDFENFKHNINKNEFEENNEYFNFEIKKIEDVKKLIYIREKQPEEYCLFKESLGGTRYVKIIDDIFNLLNENIDGDDFRDVMKSFIYTFDFWQVHSIYDFNIYFKFLLLVRKHLEKHVKKHVFMLNNIIYAISEIFISMLGVYSIEDKKIFKKTIKDVNEEYSYITPTNINTQQIILFNEWFDIISLFIPFAGQIGIPFGGNDIHKYRNTLHNAILNNEKYDVDYNNILTSKHTNLSYIIYSISREFVYKNKWRRKNIFIEYMIDFVEKEINTYISKKDEYSNFIYHRLLSLISSKNNIAYKYYKENNLNIKPIIKKYEEEIKFIGENEYQFTGMTTYSKYIDELGKIKLFKNNEGIFENTIDEYNKHLSTFIKIANVSFSLFRNNPLFKQTLDINKQKNKYGYSLYYFELYRPFQMYLLHLHHKNLDIEYRKNLNNNFIESWSLFKNIYIKDFDKNNNIYNKIAYLNTDGDGFIY